MKPGLLVCLGFVLISISGLRPAQASTFVGNGGNAGDVEWLITLRQINLTLDYVDQLPKESLCLCTDTYANHETCAALRNLSPAQVRSCQDVMKAQIPALRELVSTSKHVRVDWTYDPIEVRENGRLRGVDAVTDRTQNKITMNPDTFRSMYPYSRIFLLSHELFHLTDWKGKPMVDEGAIEAFGGPQGGRELINAMAATLTVQADQQEISNAFRGKLRRPQGWRKNWIDFGVGGIKQSSDDTFSIDDYSSVQLKYRHYFGDFGLNAGVRFSNGDRKILSTIEAEEMIQTYLLGVSYRVFPFSNPLTFFGQSHLTFGLNAEIASGKYEIKDPAVGASAKKTNQSFGAEVSYSIPLFWRLWANLNVAYQTLPGDYDVSGIQIESDDHALSSYLGVSYAF